MNYKKVILEVNSVLKVTVQNGVFVNKYWMSLFDIKNG